MIVREALCTCELVTSDIYSSDGVNKFAKRGLRVPVIFDDSDEFGNSMREVLKQSFAERLGQDARRFLEERGIYIPVGCREEVVFPSIGKGW